MLKRGGLVFAFLLAVALACPSSPAGAQPAGLPPEAQMAFERGTAAAQQQDWELAVQNFTHAYKTTGRFEAQKFPPLLFNLGLAHAKAGHELAAMAWFMAYLEAAPQAPNADAVRTEIVRLDIAVESKIRKILNEAAVIARRIPESDLRDYSLSTVARSRAGVGDINGALLTAADLSPGRRQEAKLWITYAESIAKDGRITEAEEIFSRWVGQVDTTGRDGPLIKAGLDRARREIEMEKEKASRGPVQPCYACEASRTSDDKVVVRLESHLKQAAQADPANAVRSLAMTADFLHGSLQNLREGWRAHPAYRAR